VAVGAAVALLERAVADAGQLGDRRLAAVREVGIAVAELLREIEAQAFGERGGPVEDRTTSSVGRSVRRAAAGCAIRSRSAVPRAWPSS